MLGWNFNFWIIFRQIQDVHSFSLRLYILMQRGYCCFFPKPSLFFNWIVQVICGKSTEMIIIFHTVVQTFCVDWKHCRSIVFLHVSWQRNHRIPGDVLMSAAGLRNVSKCRVVPSHWAWESSGCRRLWVGSQHLHRRTRRLDVSTDRLGFHWQPFYSSRSYLVDQSLHSCCHFSTETWAQTEVNHQIS